MNLGDASSKRLASFTLIELLTVMAIISILVGLVLMAGSGAMTKAKRSRASGEIQAIAAALESYKTDNGVYPYQNLATAYNLTTTSTLLTNSAAKPYFYDSKDGTPQNGADYMLNSRVLYMGLSGKTNFIDNPAAGVKAYMSLTIGQVGSPAGGGSYVIDPWTYSYGYSTGNGTTSYPFNGNGFFDLWSTGGNTISSPTTNAPWITNWQ